ncbi:LysR family transcriptional regulator [Parendozoicomonas haliclonae]|uniref:HTH-type transcriptional regulator BenM n=1 Tax=Parendozoicomonas haliclonae TaxID=1960125 RepID=A0A1X7ALF1_9GAMM|nr:LysR family transcriptional regulator [Parendozoicomonas haliclonae]SMA48803.1 HTH-type transcriptional regulator BenM [Parendozoicomonas haliclonae]
MYEFLPFNFRTLETFLTVIDAGGMTPAARRLGWSQSAVSQTISTLERQINRQLIVRNGRSIVLTPTGEMFYNIASEILPRARMLINLPEVGEDPKLNRLRIGMVESFAATTGAELVRGLGTQVQKIKVRSDIAPNLRSSFMDKELDLIITMGPAVFNEDAVSTTLLTESYCLAVPAQYKEQPVRLQALTKDLPFIRFSTHSPSATWPENYLRRFGMEPENCFEFDSASTVLTMVSEGMGWALVTPLTVAQGIESVRNITFVPLIKPGFFRELQLVYQDDLDRNLVQSVQTSIHRLLHDSIRPAVEGVIPWLSDSDFRIAPLPDEY